MYSTMTCPSTRLLAPIYTEQHHQHLCLSVSVSVSVALSFVKIKSACLSVYIFISVGHFSKIKVPPKGPCRGISDVPPPPLPVWNLRAVSLIPLFCLSGISGLSVWTHFSISPLLFFCLVLLLVLSYPCLLLAWSLLSLNLHFSKGMLFCVALVFFGLFERLRDEYFSWWNVQDMLPFDWY